MALRGWKDRPGMMRSNDGTPIPKPNQLPTERGMLMPNTDLSNEYIFNTPDNAHRSAAITDGKIDGMNSLRDEMLDRPGFIADGSWIFKKGTPVGERALLNQLPPGMDINNQSFIDVRDMPMRYFTGKLSFEGDGGFQEERDIPE